ncbi:hypothetical protein EV121DRAFT_206861 [Schizophyllum commune]
MSTARNIPTAIPELDYGEPPRDKEPRRSRSRSLRSVASLVLGKQNTKPSPKESNPPAPTSRWPSISALRRSQKNALPPHPEGTTSAGDASANADLYTRDRRSADIPNRRFSISRPIRLSLNLARPAKRGAIEAEVRRSAFFVRNIVADHRGARNAGDQAQAAGDQARAAGDRAQAAGHDGVGDSHSRYLRRRLEELEVDRASTRVLVGDASSHATAGDASSHATPGDASWHTTTGGASSHTTTGGASSHTTPGDASSYDRAPSVDPSLLELDVDAAQVELDVDAAQVDLDVDAAQVDLDVDAAQVDLDVDAAQVDLDVDAAQVAHDEHLADALALIASPHVVPIASPHVAPIASPRVAPIASPHVAFAEHVVEYGPGLLDLVHACYEDGDSSDAEVGGDDEDGYNGDEDGSSDNGEDGYRGDEDGYHDLDDGYHGDDELLYSSDDEDLYAYPPNAMFGVSSIASAAASNHIPTSTVAYAPTCEAPSVLPTNFPAVMPLTSRPVAVPFTSRPVAVPFTSRTPVSIPFTSRAPAAILPSVAPSVPDDAYERHAPQYEHLTPQYDHHALQYDQHHTPQYDHHTPQYAAFFSESPSSYDVAMDFLPLSDLEGTPVDEAGAPVGEGAACEIVEDSENVKDSENAQGRKNAEDGDSEDLIFPDEASFPTEPVIYETKEGGRVWKEEDMPLWTGDPSFDVPLEPSLGVPLEPLLGPLLKEERGVWRDDESVPLPPLQMDRLRPWLDGSDEEESPLSPIEGEDSLLSPASFGAELPAAEAYHPPLGVEKPSADEFVADDDALTADDDSFALFPTDPRSLPYLLRLSAEYDGTPASELNGSPFPSPLPRSPFDENVLPFADASALPLSAQEIATGHQLVRRGRAGVVARRVVVERQSSEVQADMTAQVDGTTQIESAAQVDPTMLVDFTASSPLDVFLPHVRTPASAPDLLDFFPAPSPFGDLADGMQLSESRALVRRPTEGEMAVVRAETSGKPASFLKHLHGLMSQ